MSLRHQWFVLGASAACVLGLAASAVGCRADSTSTSGSNGTGGDGATTASSSSSGSSTGGAGGVGGAGGSAGAGGAPAAGGAGGAACAGDTVTLEQVTNQAAPGAVGKGTPVTVKGVVATTRKFLVSQSNSGNCLWGVFVSAPGITETAPYSGVMVVSYGIPAEIPPGGNKAFCPKLSSQAPGDKAPGDAIPDDTMPGDVLDVTGTADYFLLSNCAAEVNGSKVAQRQISFTCGVTKTGTAPVPAAHVFTDPADIAKLASPTDTAFHDQWGGVRVRASMVKPLPDAMGALVSKFGEVTMEGSNLVAGDKIYYRGYEADKCFKGPVFTDPNTTFNFVEGVQYLNFCTWGMQPSNKCADFDPASEDCATDMLMCK